MHGPASRRAYRVSRVSRVSRVGSRIPRSAWLTCVALFASVTLAPRDAHAYRPFNGTDADVAAKDEFELELGPIGYLKEGHEHLLTAPAYVLNYGFAEDTELVMDGRGLLSLDGGAHRGTSQFTLDDTDILVKSLLRRGVLQGASGPSVALEAGALLPTVGREAGFGTSTATIVSFRNAYGTLHLNGAFLLTRDTHDRDLFAGVIVEGPSELRVRPVAELYWERDFGATTTFSALGGAIFRLKDDLDIDAALRVAKVDDETAFEARLGLTWTIPVF